MCWTGWKSKKHSMRDPEFLVQSWVVECWMLKIYGTPPRKESERHLRVHQVTLCLQRTQHSAVAFIQEIFEHILKSFWMRQMEPEDLLIY